MVKKEFPEWFGKNCKYCACVWEDDEVVGGPNYMEYEPVLSYCSHIDNYSEYEGNCTKKLCPIKKEKTNDG